MSPCALMLREIRLRWLNFALATLAVAGAAALVVALAGMGRASNIETKRLMRNLGFNLLVLPGRADLAQYWASDTVSGDMPQAYVQKLFEHVVSQDTSGRNATNTFLSGKGDVLLAYENEALLSRKNGQDIQFTIPKQTMLIETPIAVIKTSENKEKANQFIRFTKTVEAQRIWAEYGFRPVNKQVAKEFRAKFPGRPTIYRISDKIFGGSWSAADKKWFDPNGSIMVDIEKAIGGPTG